jgi:hypothetical protein
MTIKVLDARILYFGPGSILDAFHLTQYFLFSNHQPGAAGGRINRLMDLSALERIELEDSHSVHLHHQ